MQYPLANKVSLYQRFPTVLNTAVKGLHVVYTELLPLMVSMAWGKVANSTWGTWGSSGGSGSPSKHVNTVLMSALNPLTVPLWCRAVPRRALRWPSAAAVASDKGNPRAFTHNLFLPSAPHTMLIPRRLSPELPAVTQCAWEPGLYTLTIDAEP